MPWTHPPQSPRKSFSPPEHRCAAASHGTTTHAPVRVLPMLLMSCTGTSIGLFGACGWSGTQIHPCGRRCMHVSDSRQCLLCLYQARSTTSTHHVYDIIPKEAGQSAPRATTTGTANQRNQQHAAPCMCTLHLCQASLLSMHAVLHSGRPCTHSPTMTSRTRLLPRLTYSLCMLQRALTLKL